MPVRILHIDMDAFFAACEQARRPKLRGQPLIIGGNIDDTRGVVSTASYEARAFGVHSAMPLAEARRLCPQGIYLRGDHAHYAAVSRRVKAILEAVSPLVEMASIDEAYVDITGSLRLFGGDDAIAERIKRAIRDELGLPCSIAIAPNRLVAKVATNEAKPDGYCRVAAGEERAYLAPLTVNKLPGAGPKTCEALGRLGIHTIGQLDHADSRALARALGEQAALGLQRAARGEASAEIETSRAPRQISRETTFPEDRADWPALERVLLELAEHCCHRLRARGMEARRITLKVRYAPFDTQTFAHTLAAPTSVDAEIIAALRPLIGRARARRGKIRLLGVALGDLSTGDAQLELFTAPVHEKWGRVLSQVDALRGKIGFNAVRLGKRPGPR